MPGVVAVIQTSGARLNFHPNIHVLVSEGGKALDGSFRRVPSFDDELIRTFFTREVFSFLLREKLIRLSAIDQTLNRLKRSWK